MLRRASTLRFQAIRCTVQAVISSHQSSITTLRQHVTNYNIRSHNVQLHRCRKPILHCRHYNTTTYKQQQTTTQSAAQSFQQLGINTIHNNFKVISHIPVPEFNATIVKLQHTQSNTPWYHVIRDDIDNAFAVGFKTPVNNNTGVAHILEHCVLCGSQKYNVHDPFYSLMRRSLQTSMNAMTASDYTMYPISSTNHNDLQNLMSVYCDAVFFPLLQREAFLQEGHRLVYNDTPVQHSDDTLPSHTHSKLEHAGIVYNEMKGVMSDNDNLFVYGQERELFKDTNSLYVYNSGGIPADIATLTHQQLQQFHKQHYNIYNCVFVSYGCNMPLLDIVDTNVIQPVLQRNTNNTNAIHPISIASIRDLHRWTEPREIYDTCPPDSIVTEQSKQDKISLTWLCQPYGNDTTDKFEHAIESFSLQLLLSLLCMGPNTPMYQALLETQIGTDYTPDTGVDNHIKQETIGIGLCGVDLNQTQKQYIIDTIYSVLNKVVKTGFEQRYIDETMHSIELRLKSVSTEFGISYLSQLVAAYVHDHSIENNARITELLTEVKKRVKQGYLQQLIQKHMLNNTHRLTYIMQPDEQYLQKQHTAEIDTLKQLEAKLTKSDIQQIQHDNQAMKQWQEQVDDTSILPGLQVTDISPTIKTVQLHDMPLSTVKQPIVQYTIQPCNTLLYVRMLIDMANLPSHLLQYLPLYSVLVNSMATKQYDYKELAHALNLYTGGISPSLSINTTTDDLYAYKQTYTYTGYCLHYNTEKLLELMYEIIYHPVFTDKQRLQQLLTVQCTNTIQSIPESASSYATTDALATIYPATQQTAQLTGLPYIQFLSQLSSDIHDDSSALDSIIDKLQQIQQYIVQQGIAKILLHADQPTFDTAKSHIDTFVNKLTLSNTIDTAIIKPNDFKQVLYQQNYYAVPLQVNFATLTIPTVPYLYRDAATLEVLAKLVSQLYIHTEIRERGGAYGAWCTHNSLHGNLIFGSYRDPQTLTTVNTFKQCGNWLLDNKSLTQSDIDEAKLALFSQIDAPKPASSEGLAQWQLGITDEQRQQHRTELLQVTLDDVYNVAQKYIVDNIEHNKYNVTIVGKQENIDSDISTKNNWNVNLSLLQAMSE